VDPLLLQSAFRVGFIILALGLVILPFEDRSSAEFVATVLAIVIGMIFVGIVTVLARSTLPPPPRATKRNSVDKSPVKEYNDPDSRTGGD
jgi:Mn2+/Fe2+ NRAMP family transporter